MSDLIPLAIVAFVVLVAAGIAKSADRALKRISKSLSADELETFRTTYWWPRSRADMPTKYFEYAAAVDRFRRITFTVGIVAFSSFASWVIIGRATS